MLHVFYCFSANRRTRRRHRMRQRVHYATVAYFRPEASNMRHNGRGVAPSRFWPTRFWGSRWEKRPASGPGALGSTRRVYAADAPAGVSRNALAGHDLRRLASASGRRGAAARHDTRVLCRQDARKWPKIGKKQHDRIRHTPTGALGRPRAETVHESSSPGSVHFRVRVSPRGATAPFAEPCFCARPRPESQHLVVSAAR